jgi:hypothetical protein
MSVKSQRRYMDHMNTSLKYSCMIQIKSNIILSSMYQDAWIVNNYAKLIFKHKILETCIDALFDSCIASFSAPILDHSTIYSDILIGYRYDQLVFRIDVPGMI